jgi:CubicO group peptidase (beta-lactamase class C family)
MNWTLASLVLLATSLARAQFPPDAEIRNILAERIGKYKQATGMVVGLIAPEGRRIVAYGTRSLTDPRTPDAQTVYEVGSITKVFTSLILSDMVQRGEITLTDPVSKYLPAAVHAPERNGKQITLQDLATHYSGLPRDLPNGDAASLAGLYRFLSTVELKRDIGSDYEYSNLGVALLGQALANRANTDWETLVRTRILLPLGLQHTGINPTPEMSANFVPGHGYNYSGIHRVSPDDLGPIDPAGALRSNTDDLLTFLAAFLGFTETSLTPAMDAMLSVQRSSPDGKVALGWHLGGTRNCLTPIICKAVGEEIVQHGGGTPGYRAFAAFDPKARTGVVILANGGYGPGNLDLGMHLLDSRVRLASKGAFKLPPLRKPIPLSPAALDAYTGRYRFPDGDIWTFRREGDHLVMSHPTEPDAELLAEAPRKFFFTVADATVEFKNFKQGKATELHWQAAGQKSQDAKRLE